MDKLLYDRGLAKRREVLGDSYVDRALANVNDFNRRESSAGLVTEYCWERLGRGHLVASPSATSSRYGSRARQNGRVRQPCPRGTRQRSYTEGIGSRSSSKSVSIAGSRSALTASRQQKPFSTRVGRQLEGLNKCPITSLGLAPSLILSSISRTCMRSVRTVRPHLVLIMNVFPYAGP